jgi:hypothetical protein
MYDQPARSWTELDSHTFEDEIIGVMGLIATEYENEEDGCEKLMKAITKYRNCSGATSLVADVKRQLTRMTSGLDNTVGDEGTASFAVSGGKIVIFDDMGVSWRMRIASDMKTTELPFDVEGDMSAVPVHDLLSELFRGGAEVAVYLQLLLACTMMGIQLKLLVFFLGAGK